MPVKQPWGIWENKSHTSGIYIYIYIFIYIYIHLYIYVYIYCGAIITRSIFTKILMKDEGEVWGVFCEYNLWCIFASFIIVPYAKSCYVGPRYKGTWLYIYVYIYIYIITWYNDTEKKKISTAQCKNSIKHGIYGSIFQPWDFVGHHA